MEIASIFCKFFEPMWLLSPRTKLLLENQAGYHCNTPMAFKNAASHCKLKGLTTAHVLLLITCKLIIESMQVDFRVYLPSPNHPGNITFWYQVYGIHVEKPTKALVYSLPPSQTSSLCFRYIL